MTRVTNYYPECCYFCQHPVELGQAFEPKPNLSSLQELNITHKRCYLTHRLLTALTRIEDKFPDQFEEVIKEVEVYVVGLEKVLKAIDPNKNNESSSTSGTTSVQYEERHGRKLAGDARISPHKDQLSIFFMPKSEIIKRTRASLSKAELMRRAAAAEPEYNMFVHTGKVVLSEQGRQSYDKFLLKIFRQAAKPRTLFLLFIGAILPPKMLCDVATEYTIADIAMENSVSKVDPLTVKDPWYEPGGPASSTPGPRDRVIYSRPKPKVVPPRGGAKSLD